MTQKLKVEPHWPKIQIRQNKRAKYLRIVISAQNGFEIVAPPGVNLRKIDRFLHEKRNWINKTLSQIELPKIKRPIPLPEEIKTFYGTWKVAYQQEAETSLKLKQRGHQAISLVGECSDQPSCKALLKKWLKQQAKTFLKERLNLVSARIELPYNRLSIRDQTTRWGSCSAKKDITLNYKLIFLPLALADYIMIHELCHTVYLNHSPLYWKLVARFEPHYTQHLNALKKAEVYIPPWLTS